MSNVGRIDNSAELPEIPGYEENVAGQTVAEQTETRRHLLRRITGRGATQDAPEGLPVKWSSRRFVRRPPSFFLLWPRWCSGAASHIGLSRRMTWGGGISALIRSRRRV